jgi:aryl carrier-like protein
MWASGASIDWNRLYSEEGAKPHRISLPTYPFERKRFWIQGAGSDSVPSLVRAPQLAPSEDLLEKGYYRSIWKATPLTSDTTNLQNVVLFNADDEFFARYEHDCERVVLVKRGKGYKEIGKDAYEIDTEQETDYTKLFKSLQTHGVEIDNVVWVSPYGEKDASNRRVRRGTPGNVSYELFFFSRALMDFGAKHPIRLIYMNRLSGGVEDGYGSALFGLARSVRLENANLKYHVVDVDPCEAADIDLVAMSRNELLGIRDDEIAVRYRQHVREVKQVADIDVFHSEDGIKIKRDGCYLITGGMGGVGLIFARYLAETYGAKVILTGRSAPDQKTEQTISDLSALGGEASYVQADVSSKDDMKKALAEIRKRYTWIDGVIHSAGTIDDKLLINKDVSTFDRVTAPKIEGLINLDELTKDDNLDFFVLFSSIAAVLGNVGQCDYAYANSFMDWYATYRNSLVDKGFRRGSAIAINWPLWKEGGMRLDKNIEEMQRRFFGLEPLETVRGLRAFEDALRLGITPLIIMPGAREKIKSLLGMEVSREQAAGVEIIRSSDEGADEVRASIKSIIAHVLKVEAHDIDDGVNLQEYGIDSILMMQMMMLIREKYGEIDIDPSTIVDNPTIDAISHFVVARLQQEREADDETSWNEGNHDILANSAFVDQTAHPFVDAFEALSDTEVVVKKSFSLETDPLFRDHVIMGIPRMMGVGFLELMWSAIRRSGVPINTISDVVLIHPISLGEGVVNHTTIRLSKTKGGLYTIDVGSIVEGREYKNAAAKGKRIGHHVDRVDIQSFMEEFGHVEDIDFANMNSGDAKAFIGPYFHAKTSVQWGDGGCFARLNLSPKAAEMNYPFRLHIGLLDPAVYLAIFTAHKKIKTKDKFLLLPIYFEEVCIYGEVNKECYVKVDLMDTGADIANMNMLTFNMRFFSPDGESLVFIKGMKLKKLVQE